MAKLHELIAVCSNLNGQAAAAMADLKNTFEKKRHHFMKKLVTFLPNTEGASPVTEEQLDLQTTVGNELTWVSKFMNKAIDASFQVAVGNTSAMADVVLEDGTIIVKNIPATALLELEKRLNEISDLVKAIPTLDPAKGFKPAPDQGPGVYVARPEERIRTKKSKEVLMLAPATEKHPAQVQVYDVDAPVGVITTQEWSGLITPAEKSNMLDRLENLLRAVKRARSRANETVVDANNKIGDTLTSYIFGL